MRDTTIQPLNTKQEISKNVYFSECITDRFREASARSSLETQSLSLTKRKEISGVLSRAGTQSEKSTTEIKIIISIEWGVAPVSGAHGHLEKAIQH